MPDPSRTFSGGITYKMEGLANLERLLDELRADLRRKVVIGALRDAAKPMQKAAQKFAQPRDFGSNRRIAGTLRRGIRVFLSKKHKGQNGVIGVYITVRATKASRTKRPVSGDPFYWRFVENGHRIVPRLSKVQIGFSNARKRLSGLSITQRRKKAGGRVKAYPFLMPGFQAGQEQARTIFEQRIRERIEKANGK